MWGVSRLGNAEPAKLEMTLYVGEGEDFVLNRLAREKRCGAIEQVDERHWRFTCRVLDPLEMMPWLRTFIGRITDLRCDDPRVEQRFNETLEAMAESYRAGELRAAPGRAFDEDE